MLPANIRRRAVERTHLARQVFGRSWARRAIVVWTFLGAWDLALSQLMPPSLAEHFPKVYQVIGMTSSILPLWGWLVGTALLLAGISFEYAFRQSRRVNALVPKDAARGTYKTKSSHLPERASPSTGEGAARTGEPAEADAALKVMETAPNWDWERLYRTGKSGELCLRFLPDTSSAASDALILIVYGYSILWGVQNVSVRSVHDEVGRLMSSNKFGWDVLGGSIYTQIVHAVGFVDYGEAAVQAHLVRRVNLLAGGSYELTEYGLSKAKGLAWDLIDRA